MASRLHAVLFFPFHSRFTGAQSVENEGHLVKFLLQHFRMLQDAARALPTPSQHLLTRSNNVTRRFVEMLPAFRPGLYNAAKRHFGLPKRHL